MAEPILIVLPTRDRPGMLVEAVRSVLAQTDPDWRLVVADDGDGEPAEKALAPLLPKDPRVAFVRSAARSPGGARNIAFAHGEREVLRAPAALVAFLDDDDLWLPRHLAACRETLARAPEAALVHGAVTNLEDGVESPYHRFEHGPFEGHVWARLLHGLDMLPSSIVVRGEPYRAAGGFRADLSNIQDLDLWLKMLRHAPVAYVSEITVVRRIHAGCISRNALNRVRDKMRVLEHWWARRETLSPEDRRKVRRLLADRRRRHVHRLLRDPGPTRAEVRKTAWSYFRSLPGLSTLRGAAEAAFAIRRTKA